MEIVKANASHKNLVLKILDEFRSAVSALIDPEKNFTFTTAQESGGVIFDEVINSNNAAIFIALEQTESVGIFTIFKIPQIRKGTYYAEIEDVYVKPNFQGKGVAQALMNAAETWAKEQNVSSIRLESGIELVRAHAFYEKSGLTHYGKAFRKKII